MADNSPNNRKDSPSKFFFRKKADSSANTPKDSPSKTTRKKLEKDDSPKLDYGPAVKLSDVSRFDINSKNSAMVNFSARKKTISEYLAPLTGLFASRRSSALERLSFRGPVVKSSSDEDERRRVRELMFGMPMRRFSFSHSQNIPRSGTLRVRIIACTSNKLKASSHVSMSAAKRGGNSSPVDNRKISGESTGSHSSAGGPAPVTMRRLSRHHNALSQKHKTIRYYVEMDLGGAKGRTDTKEKLKKSRRGEVRWDDSNAWIRLFVPGMEEGGDAILQAVSEAAKQTNRRPLSVLRFKVICVTGAGAQPPGEDHDNTNTGGGQLETHTLLFETAVELDRLVSKGAPRLLELPLVNKDDPEDEDLGVLTLETRFDRMHARRMSQEDLLLVEAAENLAAETASLLILTGQQRTTATGAEDDVNLQRMKQVGRMAQSVNAMMKEAGTGKDALVADDHMLAPILMVPSAAAYLTTVAAGLVPTNLYPAKLSRGRSSSASGTTRVLSQKLRIVYEHDESLRASWPLLQKEHARTRQPRIGDGSEDIARRQRRFSCPHLGSTTEADLQEMFPGFNTEQLESLREGWRMWRMAHRSQLMPSHRAQDFANVGERFINRANSSSSMFSGAGSPRGSVVNSAPSSPSFTLLEKQSSSARTRTLFELGGDAYDVSTYLDDHPRQRAFLDSISARVGKIAMLEHLSSARQGEGGPSEDARRKQKQSLVKATKYWCRKKVAILTGSTSGIGECVGRELCARGVKRLIILVRNLSTGRKKAREWTEKYKNIEVDVVQCDLSSMKDTNAALDQVRGLFAPDERLDLLILCAACVCNETTVGPRKELEETFAVNFMSNFLLVHGLFDLMEREPQDEEDEGRIIFAGCAAVPPFGNKVDLDDLQATKCGIGQLGVSQYIHTKTMLSCFATELARRLEDRGSRVTANVFFPGAVKSKLADKVLEAFNPVIARLADAAYGLTEGILVRSPEQGAALAVNLCSSSSLCGVNGKVFHSGLTGQVTDFEPHLPFGVATNMELCRKLWAVSGKMLNHALGKDSRVAEWWGYFAPARKGEHHFHQHASTDTNGGGLMKHLQPQ